MSISILKLFIDLFSNFLIFNISRFKTSFLILLFLLGLRESHCQITKDNIKPLLFEGIETLSSFEGIFIINSANIEQRGSFGCLYDGWKHTLNLNDTIAIFEVDRELLVFSYNSNCIVGHIKLGEHRRGKFYPNPKSQYPPCGYVVETVWDWDITASELSLYHNIFPSVNIALNKIFQNCDCEREYLREGYTETEIKILRMCDLTVRFNLNKIFPNKSEPPISRASGTGVIISKDGYVLTNRHVVERYVYSWQTGIESTWKKENSTDFSNPFFNISTDIHTVINNKEYKLTPIEIGKGIIYHYFGGYSENKAPADSTLIHTPIEEDLILLKIVDPPSDLKFAIFDTTSLKLGQQIYTLGYPLSNTLNNQLIYTNGYYSGQSNKVHNTSSVEIFNLGINPGNSGGGIFNATNGQLIGIATARLNDDKLMIKTEGIAFGTRLNQIVSLLKKKNYYCVLYNTALPDNTFKSRAAYFSTNFYQFDDFHFSQYKAITRKIPILVKDNSFSPVVSTETNQSATIQILVK